MEIIDNNRSNLCGNNTRAELYVKSETVHYCREPPPPYTEEPTELATVTAQQPSSQTIIVQPPLKLWPTYFNCHVCSKRVFTRVEHVNTRKTHLLAGFICGFTLWCMLCGLAALPYLLPTFKNTKHYCPTCNTLLGVYSKI